jgi:hypothetical protein
VNDPLFIPSFRAHVAISRLYNEIIMAAQMSSADSPYPEFEAGYSWHDFVPVSVLPYDTPSASLGQRIKDILQLSRRHYKAPATKALLKEWESRKRILEKLFGDPDRRREVNRVFGPWAAIASSAPDLVVFWTEYEHFIVEDHGNDRVLIGKFTDLRKLTKTSDLDPSVIVNANKDAGTWWQSLLALG